MLELFKRKEKEVSNFERIKERLHDELGTDLLNVNYYLWILLKIKEI